MELLAYSHRQWSAISSSLYTLSLSKRLGFLDQKNLVQEYIIIQRRFPVPKRIVQNEPVIHETQYFAL